MSDLPPADWYTDPEDESLYRYWDGSSWTEHRAPRHTHPEGESESDADRMRGPGKLVGSTFSLTGRQWRDCAVAALVSVAAQVVMVALILIAANDIVMGELGEIWDRVSDPAGFDPTTPENEAYFESLEVDLSPVNFVPIALALLIVWVAGNLVKATVTRIALSDLRGRVLSVSGAFKQALPRIPRLMGLDLKILAIFVVAMVVAVLAGFVAPVLLILLLPAVVAGFILAIAVISLAYVVASVGPAEPSLRYGLRLVRGRFWASLGRMLLVWLVIFAISFAVGIVPALLGAAAGPSFQLVSQAVQTVVGAALGVLGLVAAMILYDDLGGESD